MSVTIRSIAHYVPDDIYSNEYFESYLDTTSDWILERTGIYERRILKNGATSDLLVPAAKEAMEKANLGPEDIDVIVVGTVTPDHLFPNTASIVQRKLGLKKCWGYDVSAACSGFIFALISAKSLIEAGTAKRVLLLGGDKMSSITNYQDRSQAILFGDAGTACILEESNDPELGIQDYILNMDGSGGKYLYQLAGGSFMPPSEETVKLGQHFLYQEGQAVFKAAVVGMADVSEEIMKRNNLSADDIAYLVPHQANLRIISATAKRMNLSPEKVMINIQKYGNTTAATIPMCMSEWFQAGKINKGDRLILSSFGAGYTYGSILLRWNMND